MKKVAVLNDLSGLGKCSLTAAIPVLSVMGVQACPLPTAVLSAQTGFSSYYYDDYTRHIEEIIKEWKKMDFRPDGIYTGFLAGDVQAERVLDFVKKFQKKDTKVLVDPILGDNGEEYPMYTESLCGRMRCLVERASIITPNLTEALLLLYGQDKMHEIWADLTKTVKNRTQESAEETKKKSAKADRKCFEETVEQIGTALAEQFQTEVVITGIDIPQEDGGMKIGNLICRGRLYRVGRLFKRRGKLFRHRRSFRLSAVRGNGKRNQYCPFCEKSGTVPFKGYSRYSSGRYGPKRGSVF